MRKFKEFKESCIEMVLDCHNEDFNDCEMAQELSNKDSFTELAKVMVEWEYWEMEDALSYGRSVEEVEFIPFALTINN